MPSAYPPQPQLDTTTSPDLPGSATPPRTGRRAKGSNARRWIAIGAAAAVVIAGGITATVLLTRQGSTAAADDFMRVAAYPQAPTGGITVRLTKLLPDADTDSGMLNPLGADTISIISASPERVVVQALGIVSHPGTTGKIEPLQTVAAVDAKGDLVWQVKGTDLWGGQDPTGYFDCAPTGSRIVCGQITEFGSVIRQINAADGTLAGDPIEIDSRLWGGDSGVVTVLDQDVLTFDKSSKSYTISRVSLATGKALWTTDDLTSEGGYARGAEVVGKFLVTTETFGSSDVQTDLIDPATGKIVQHLDGTYRSRDGGATWVGEDDPGAKSGQRGVRVVGADGATLWTNADGDLVYGFSGGPVLVASGTDESVRLSALDPGNGNPLWKSAARLSATPYGSVPTGSSLVLITGDGLTLLNPSTGDQVKARLAGDFVGRSDAALYAYDGDTGSLFAYDSATGDRVWRASVASLARGSGDKNTTVRAQRGYLVVTTGESATVLLPGQ